MRSWQTILWISLFSIAIIAIIVAVALTVKNSSEKTNDKNELPAALIPVTISPIFNTTAKLMFQQVLSKRNWGHNAAWDEYNEQGIAFDSSGTCGLFFGIQDNNFQLGNLVQLNSRVQTVMFSSSDCREFIGCFISSTSGIVDIWMKSQVEWVYIESISRADNLPGFGTSLAVYEHAKEHKTYLLISSHANIISVFSKRRGKIKETGNFMHEFDIDSGDGSHSIALSHDGHLVFSGYTKTKMSVLHWCPFPWRTEQQTYTMSLSEPIRQVKISRDGYRALCAFESHVVFWRFRNKLWSQSPSSLKIHNIHVVVNNNWQEVGVTDVNKKVRLYEIDSDGIVNQLPQQTEFYSGTLISINKLALISDNDKLIVYSREKLPL